MAKAGGNTTTTWTRYSQAKALAGEYLGDSKFVERELQRGLAAGEIPWRCVRFEAPEQYSGPGCGDQEFWKLGAVRSGRLILNMRGIRTEGDSATRMIDGGAAYGIDLDRAALVRLKLLPADNGAETTSPLQRQAGKSLIEAEVRRRAAAGEHWDSITELSESLREWMETVSDRPLKARSIENCLREKDLWSLLSKK
ncbi:MAG TPA: hypothetical protein VMS82_16535 [Pseudolabrys sp.]|jgi:hypothetical protein|nr:hypothetical protein [Pseudolabrys sp.]